MKIQYLTRHNDTPHPNIKDVSNSRQTEKRNVEQVSNTHQRPSRANLCLILQDKFDGDVSGKVRWDCIFSVPVHKNHLASDLSTQQSLQVHTRNIKKNIYSYRTLIPRTFLHLICRTLKAVEFYVNKSPKNPVIYFCYLSSIVQQKQIPK